MSAVETLRMLAAGECPASGLLHTARLAAFGVECYGEEAIVDSFSRAPIVLSGTATVVETSSHLAIFDGDTALIADLYSANIARLWRLGCGDPLDAEQGISVVFDPDLAQARGDICLAASDHPALAGDAIDRAAQAGRAITRNSDNSDNSYRSRAFAIRAFGTAAEGVALFAVYRLAGEPARTSGFAMAAVRWMPDNLRIVRDLAGEQAVAKRPWTPRIKK